MANLSPRSKGEALWLGVHLILLYFIVVVYSYVRIVCLLRLYRIYRRCSISARSTTCTVITIIFVPAIGLYLCELSSIVSRACNGATLLWYGRTVSRIWTVGILAIFFSPLVGLHNCNVWLILLRLRHSRNLFYDLYKIEQT